MVLIVVMLVAFATSCNPTPPQASDDELFVEFSKSLPIASYIATLDREIKKITTVDPATEEPPTYQFKTDAPETLSMLLFFSGACDSIADLDFDTENAIIVKDSKDEEKNSPESKTKTNIYQVKLNVEVPYAISKKTEEKSDESGKATGSESPKLVFSGEIYERTVSDEEDNPLLLEMKFSNMVVNGVSYKDVAIRLEGTSLTSATVGGKEVANKQALLPIVFQFINYGS